MSTYKPLHNKATKSSSRSLKDALVRTNVLVRQSPRDNDHTTYPLAFSYFATVCIILFLMGDFLLKLFLGDAATFGAAFTNHPFIMSFKVLALLAILVISCIIIALINRRFGSKSGNSVVNTTSYTSYGQGGQAGPGGQGGAGGNVAIHQGFPFEPGQYQIKVGEGGGPGQAGEASSITTPSGQVIIVGGGQGGQESTSN